MEGSRDQGRTFSAVCTRPPLPKRNDGPAKHPEQFAAQWQDIYAPINGNRSAMSTGF
jgi:hypothetical protein